MTGTPTETTTTAAMPAVPDTPAPRFTLAEPVETVSQSGAATTVPVPLP